MSDFLLHFNKTRLDKDKIVTSMKYFDDIDVRLYDYPNCSLFLSRPDDWGMWGPYETNDGNLLVALAGRVAFESADWDQAGKAAGPGGLACKAIYNKYLSGGIRELEKLNGNFVTLIVDSEKEVIHIVTDRCGMFPCYNLMEDERPMVIGSHPDIMAMAMNISQDWDWVSMAEFLMTGRVSFPFSYYNKIRAMDYGSVHEIHLNGGKDTRISGKKYFEFSFNVDHSLGEWELAEELALAFRKAVNRRTRPQFGQTGISLSGGLDSRTLLCSADDKSNISTFCFFDEENLESEIAKQIAQKVGVKFIPLRRDFDHYGDNAEMGVKISGGMGNFGNNHYLGFRDSLKEHGITNILTGCYCDYFFKGLALDIKTNKYLRIERLSKFKDAYYHPYLSFNTPYSTKARERLNAIFPEELKHDQSDIGRLKREEKRLFPLSCEADNPQRLVPQRVMPWFLPIVDNDIVDLYLKVPPGYKLNTSIFSRMAEIQSGKDISKIPNSNTGVRVNAPLAVVTISLYKRALLKRLNIGKKGIAKDGSWPNWEYYIDHSEKIKSLWMRNNERGRDIFRQILGQDPYEKTIREYNNSDANLTLFLRLLTLKLWFEQRM
jgi:asparagine synthase (glutamine-hydrolysing)